MLRQKLVLGLAIAAMAGCSHNNKNHATTMASARSDAACGTAMACATPAPAVATDQLAGSWQLANLGPRMAKADFAPGFMIDLQQKDLRLVLEAAAQSRAALPAASLVHQLFTSAQAAGHGRDGTQALYTVLGKLSS